jgi:hypothetical protein
VIPHCFRMLLTRRSTCSVATFLASFFAAIVTLLAVRDNELHLGR